MNADSGAERLCSVEGCDRPAWCRGWCTAHYFRWRSTGDVRPDEPISRTKQPPTCTVAGCDRKTYARGLCAMHYKRQVRHGDAQAEVPPRGTFVECSVEDCHQPVSSRGWCHGHYQRWCSTGDVKPHVPLVRKKQPDICTVAGCERSTKARGYCRAHYARWLKHGDTRPDVPLRIVTGQGAISHGYLNVPVPPRLRHLTNGEKSIGEHRLVMAAHLGRPLRSDEVVHHRDGNRLNNAIENLELWSTAHPKGQRVEDKVAWAVHMLRLYAPSLLAPDVDPGAEAGPW